MKRAICAIVLCCSLLLSACALFGCSGKTKAPKVTLVDWEDETIEVTLHSDVSLSTDAVYDTRGNAYATAAKVTTQGGDAVQVLGGKFTADYAGGYIIEYSLTDTSVRANSRKVTVNIRGSETPVPYFTKSNLRVYENTPFAVPAHGVNIAPSVSVTEALALYRISDESGNETREKVDADLSATLTLPAGNYAFELTATAGEKSATASLPFRVRLLDEKYALATLNSAGEIAVGVSFWNNGIGGWDMGNVGFTAEERRNELVSSGSAVTELTPAAADATFNLIPELGREEFVQAMGEQGAAISVWFKVASDSRRPHTVTYGSEKKDAPRKSISVLDNVWTNLIITADDYGLGSDLDELYTRLRAGTGGSGDSLLHVKHSGIDNYKVYIDSVYIATPVTATFADKTVAYNATEKLTAQSEQTSEFLYELYDYASVTDTATLSADGTFTFDVVGKIEAQAFPRSNRHYLNAPLSATITVTHDKSIAFQEESYTLQTGVVDMPMANYEGTVSYRVETADGKPNYSYVKGYNVPAGMEIADGKIRMFEGDYKLYAFANVGGVKYAAFTSLHADKDNTKENGDIVHFNNPSSEQFLRESESGFYAYVGDYKGASGVMKFAAGAMGEWPQMRISKALHTAAELTTQGFTANDYLAMRIYGENLPRQYYAYFTNAYGTGTDRRVAYLAQDCWQTIYVPASEYLSHESNWLGDNVGNDGEKHPAGFCFTNNGRNNAEIYIDRIWLVKANGNAVAQQGKTMEYNLFANETDTAKAALNNMGAPDPLPVVRMDSYNSKQNVLRVVSHTDETWPTFAIAARADKTTYTNEMSDGEGWNLQFNVTTSKAHNHYTLSFRRGMDGAQKLEEEVCTLTTNWQEVTIPAAHVLHAMDSDGTMKEDAFFILAVDGNTTSHDVYIADMKFVRDGIVTSLTENGVLTVPTGATVKYNNTETLTKTGTADGKDSYNLAAKLNGAVYGSQDVNVTVSLAGQNDKTVTWSSPAAANEINAFGSTRAKEKFLAAEKEQDTVIAVIDSYRGTHSETKYGVAHIKLHNNADDAVDWGVVRFGMPMKDKAAYDTYLQNKNACVVFTMLATQKDGSAVNNMLAQYKEGANVLYEFAVQSYWAEYWLPVKYFDYDKFASGVQFINFYGGTHTNQTVYIDSIRFETRTAAEKSDVKFEVKSFNSIASASEFGIAGGNQYLTWVDTVTLGGVPAHGALRLQATGSYPEIDGFIPRATKQEYVDWFDGAENIGKGVFVLQLYNAGGDASVEVCLGDRSQADNRKNFSLYTGWNTLTIDAQYALDNFANWRTVAYITPMWGSQSDSDTHDVYFTDMYFAKDVQGENTAMKIDFINFNSAVSRDKYGYADANHKWISYMQSIVLDGQTVNAVRHYAIGAWPTVRGIRPAFTEDAYKEFFGVTDPAQAQGNLCIRVYNKDTGTQPTSFQYRFGSEQFKSVSMQAGWQTLRIPAADILAKFASLDTLDIMPYRNDTDNTTEMYITEMYFEKV